MVGPSHPTSPSSPTLLLQALHHTATDLPHTKKFMAADLTRDTRADLEQAEKGG